MEILQKESTATASTLVTATTTSVGDLSLSNSGGKVKQVLFPEDDGAYTPRKTSPPIQNEVKTQSSSSNNSISVQNMSTAGKQISPLSAVENNLKKSVQVMKSAEEARQQQVLMNTKQQETLSRQTSPPSNQSQVATVIECTIKPLSPKNKSNSNLTQSSFMDTPKVKGISSTTSASNLSLPNEPSTPTSRSNKKVSQVFEAITSSSLVSKVGSAFKSNLFDGQKTSSSTHTTIKKPASAQLVQTYLPTNIDNYPESEKERAIFDCEQEALNMAWQAHAHAMALATERGEYPSIQSFLRTPRRNSPKVWAVLKDGYVKLFAQPAENVSKQVSLEGSEPLMVYHTAECVCVPLENAMSFEVSFLSLTGSGEYSNPIVFWAETDIQCRGWVMAIQHSSIIAPLSRCTPDT